jgi:two-component system, NarL family, sensor kinase
MQFAVTGTIAVLVLGFAAVALLRNTGTSEAIRDAKQLTRLAGVGIVAPAVTPALAAGDPKAVAAIDRVVRRGVLHDPVVRVKIWDAHGRILYSDERRLIGSTYPLRADEREALRAGTAAAEVSDLSRPENRFERSHKKLLEVYLGIRPHGEPLLFESYQRFSSISASGQRLWMRFLPALIGALLVLELAQIPLAWSLARRLRRGQDEREALLRRAIDASEVERRRIAGDLHDGVVQNLAGVGYSLAATAEQLPPGSAARRSVEDGAAQTRRSVRELRTLLVDIYPPTLHRSGIDAALCDLLTALKADGLAAELDVQGDLKLPTETEALLFRTAQEALRNVRGHAQARHVRVSVAQRDATAAIEISDDGRGFDVETIDDGATGHFGLRMLGDLARDAGGKVEVTSTEGRGTTVRMEVPLS